MDHERALSEASPRFRTYWTSEAQSFISRCLLSSDVSPIIFLSWSVGLLVWSEGEVISPRGGLRYQSWKGVWRDWEEGRGVGGSRRGTGGCLCSSSTPGFHEKITEQPDSSWTWALRSDWFQWAGRCSGFSRGSEPFQLDSLTHCWIDSLCLPLSQTHTLQSLRGS